MRLGLSLSLFACEFLPFLLCFQFTQGSGTLILKVAEFEGEIQILVTLLFALGFELIEPFTLGGCHAPFLMVVHIGGILGSKEKVAQRRNAVTYGGDDALRLLPALTLLALFGRFGSVLFRVNPVLNGLDLAVSPGGSVNALLLFGRECRRLVFRVG